MLPGENTAHSDFAGLLAGSAGHPVELSDKLVSATRLLARNRLREWKKPGPSRCESHRRQVMQSAVQHRSPHGSDAVRTWWRPAHASAFGHPRVGDLGDRAFGTRARDRLPGTVAGAVVDESTFVVSHQGKPPGSAGETVGV